MAPLDFLRHFGRPMKDDDFRAAVNRAVKADGDSTEELTRLSSHLDQFRQTCDAEAPAGRTLDFLCQEILRELNTIGSKANHLDITKRIIAAKNELERIREQVQNIE